MRLTSPFRRLALFGTAYFVEGAVLTYFSTFNVIYLRTFDLSFTRIGIVGGITLFPFVLKIFIGLLSDRLNLLGLGHRKPYIVLGLLLQSLPFLLFPRIDPAAQFGLFVVMCVLAALGMSTYDTCTDGFSIDVTPEEERGVVQGIMVGGRALSAVVIADDRVEIELDQRPVRSSVSPFEGEFFAALERVLRRDVPGCVVVPMQTPGGTDSRFFRQRGVAAYGLIPIALERGELNRMHGIDERISLDNLRLGTRVVCEMLREVCC